MFNKWRTAEERGVEPSFTGRSVRPGRLAIAFSVLLLVAGTISVHSYFRMIMAVEDLNDIVTVAASAQDIRQATIDLDQLALACVMDDSPQPRRALDARWRQVETELARLHGMVSSRRGQAAVLALERLTQVLREAVSVVLSGAKQGEQVRFSQDIEGIRRVARFIASECETLVADDLGYFYQVQATIRKRTAQTALTIIVSVAVVLILSLFGQAVVFSARIREIRENQEQKERLLSALSAKGRDLERQVEERTRAEEALRQNEARITSLFDSIRDAVVATDQQGRIARLNPVAREWLGNLDCDNPVAPVEQVLRLHDPGRTTVTSEIVREVLDTGTPYVSANPLMLLRPDQPSLPVSASVSPIRSQNGEFVGSVIVLRDVSEALAIQQRIQHTAKMEAIGQLAGGVAHDFNNLLAGIVGNAELLQANLATQRQNAELAIQIQRISERAAELVRRLLDFARRGQVQRATVNLHAIIEEAVGLLAHSIDKRIRLVRELDASKAWVNGDATQLQNAILNLGLNARDAMPSGGELTIQTRNEPYGAADGIVIEVRDTGQGIPPELLDRIFEPFFTTKDQGKGTGLGLASVYGCVQSHQGDIHVESTLDRGSIFRIRLPVTERPNAKNTSVKPERESMSGLAIVVDDEEMVRTIAERHLVRLGFEVLSTGDVQQSLDWVRERRGQIALALLDLTMPQMSGTELLRAMRALDPTLPILLVSGYTSNPEVKALLQAGAARFLAKPFRSQELAEEIKVMIRPAQV